MQTSDADDAVSVVTDVSWTESQDPGICELSVIVS